MIRAAASSHSSRVPLKTPLGEQRVFKRGLKTAVDSSTNKAGYVGVCVSDMTPAHLHHIYT